MRVALSGGVALLFAGLVSSQSGAHEADLLDWTPERSIAVTYFERSPYGWVSLAADDPVHMSPSGSRFFFVTRRGDLTCDCNVFEIRAFETKTVEAALREKRAAPALPLLSFTLRSNSSTAAGMSHLRWSDDEQSILFIGQKDDLAPQLYKLDIKAGDAAAMTNVPHGVTSYDARAGTVVYRGIVERKPRTKLDTYPMTFVNHRDLAAAIGSQFDSVFHDFISYKGLDSIDLGRTENTVGSYWLSPDGARAVSRAQVRPAQMPASWFSYRRDRADPKAALYARNSGSSDTWTAQYFLIDAKTGAQKPILDAPSGEHLGYETGSTEALWFPSADRVVLVNTMLPLDAAEPARQSTAYVVDVSVTTGSWRIVTQIHTDARRLVNVTWGDSGKELLVSYRAAADAYAAPSQRETFRLTGDRWVRGSVKDPGRTESPRPRKSPLQVLVRESANDPPVAIARLDGHELALSGPDDALKSVRVARTEPVDWTDRQGRKWYGGLTKPAASAGNDRPPLVILAYVFEPGLFLPDGFTTTAFAAQALAAQGMAVLQMRLPPNAHTPRENDEFVEGVDSAVETLARTAAIDPARVGLVGFSHSGALTAYAISHPGRVTLAAAIDADGGDANYWDYLMDYVVSTSSAAKYMESANGGKPFWKDKERWMQQAPGFNLERVETPLLITTNGRHNAAFPIEIFVGLQMNGKPVDYALFPKGTHALRRPRERLRSMELTVDWMNFWLRDLLSALPDKEEQNQRWQALRDRQSRLSSALSRSDALK